MKYKKYAKVVTNRYSLCAIYEPHPFRSSVIADDDEWIWVHYDYCGNPIGLSTEQPEGVEVDKFTTDNLDLSYTTPECAQKIVDYFNKEE